MSTNYEENNRLTLVGKVTSDKVFSHEIYGEKFYIFNLSVPRLSGSEDIIPITISERLLTNAELKINDKISIDGQFRSYNSYQNEKVMMIIFKQLYPTDSNTNDDQEDPTIENEEDTSNLEQSNIEELDEAFEDLKTESNITYNVLEDGEVIEIDFTISNHETLNLTKFTNNLADQRAYYENLGLTEQKSHVA